MGDRILDVDLLAFETGGPDARRAVVDGVRRSLETGFVYSSHDISEDLLDEAYGLLDAFFALPAERKVKWTVPEAHGATGYTGLSVETAVGSDTPDWKEMLNWSTPLPARHPLRRDFPAQYPDQVLPEADVAGITDILERLHRGLLDLQTRVLRIVALGLGAAETFFDDMLLYGSTLNRAIRYPPMAEAGDGSEAVWAAEHADINLITALPRASTRGLQVKTEDGWIDARPPARGVILNTGLMLERLSNGIIPSGWHRVVADPDQRAGRLSVVQFCHPAGWTVLNPIAASVDERHPQRYAGIRAGDLLARVVWDLGLAAH
jgi:isopenicillin N synthase-like dioxygenase